jgi:hypothetical protein
MRARKITVRDTLPNPCEMVVTPQADGAWLYVIAPKMPELIPGKEVAFMRLDLASVRRLARELSRIANSKQTKRSKETPK